MPEQTIDTPLSDPNATVKDAPQTGLVQMADAFVKLRDGITAQPEKPKAESKPDKPKAKKAAPQKAEPKKPDDAFDFNAPELEGDDDDEAETKADEPNDTPDLDAEDNTPDQDADDSNTDPDVPKEIKSKKAADHFRNLASLKDKAEAEASRLRAELETVKKSKPEDTALFKSLKEENEQLTQRIQMLDVTQDPRFQKYFTGKEDHIQQQIHAVLGKEQGDEILNLINRPDSQAKTNAIEEAISDLSPYKQNTVAALALQASSLQSERQQAIEEASKGREAMIQSRELAAKEQQAKIEKTFEDVLRSAKTSLPIFAQKEGEDAWNQEVSDRVELAKSIFMQESDPGKLAKAALWAAAGPKLRQVVQTQEALIGKLQKQLKKQQATSPSMAGTAKTPATKPEGFVSKFMEEVGWSK